MLGSHAYFFSRIYGSNAAGRQRALYTWGIEETNGNDHRGWFYIICITKTDRLITQNMQHTCRVLISTEQYLHKQIKKTAGQLEELFMQALQHTWMPKLCTAGAKTHIILGKEILNRKGEKKDSILHIWWNAEASDKHGMCNNQSDCKATDDASSISTGSSPSHIKI